MHSKQLVLHGWIDSLFASCPKAQYRAWVNVTEPLDGLVHDHRIETAENGERSRQTRTLSGLIDRPPHD